jgi:hypothetical protein
MMMSCCVWSPLSVDGNKAQEGQAMALGLGLVSLGALAMVLSYNGGQTVAARAHLTHAVDAAAYSGAVVQARALNLLASINRAQIAHQVAMAHLITLGSWAKFAATEATQDRRGNPPLHVITMMFGLAHGLAYAGSITASGVDRMTTEGGALTQAFTGHDRVVHDVLERSSSAILRTLAQARIEAMQATLSANFPNLRIEIDGSAKQLAAVVSGDRPGASEIHLSILNDGLDRFLVTRDGNGPRGVRPLMEAAASHYGFLGKRDHVARNLWPVSYICPLLRHELRRRGATLLDPWGRWQSDDTQSYHALRSNRYIGCYFREYEMGWGSAYGRGPRARDDFRNNEPLPKDFSGEAFWRWAKRHLDFDIAFGYQNPMGNARAKRAIINWKQRGLPQYVAVEPARVRDPLRFAILLQQRSGSLATTDAASAVRLKRGRFAYRGLADRHTVSVTAAGETYYEPPMMRVDGKIESGNLFRPYWQARLSPTTSAERLAGRRNVDTK